VQDRNIFSQDELKFLRSLIREKVDFMIVGLAGAALQGAPVVTQDIDLWFRDLSDPGIRRALKKVGAAFVPQVELNPPMFAGQGVNLFDIVVHMHGLKSFGEEIENTVTIPIGNLEVKVLKLERIIASKKATNRRKDRLVLPVLRDSLRVIRQNGGA